MHNSVRWAVQGIVFLIVFWGLGWILGEPDMGGDKAVLIFLMYVFVTALLEKIFSAIRTLVRWLDPYQKI
jgi:hypothetical protein